MHEYLSQSTVWLQSLIGRMTFQGMQITKIERSEHQERGIVFQVGSYFYPAPVTMQILLESFGCSSNVTVHSTETQWMGFAN